MVVFFTAFFRNFANKLAKLLRLGNKNKRVCFVFLSTFRNFGRIRNLSNGYDWFGAPINRGILLVLSGDSQPVDDKADAFIFPYPPKSYLILPSYQPAPRMGGVGSVRTGSPQRWD